MNLIKAISLVLIITLFSSCKKYKAKHDDTSPELSLNGSKEMAIPYGVDTPDPGATAKDNIDGDITSKVESDWNSKVDKNVAGEYTVTYSVSDKKGNTTQDERKVSVKMNAACYFGVYSSTFTVVGGGSAVVICTVSAGANADQFLVDAYLGNGGIPFYVNVSGDLGADLNVVPTTGGVVLTGSGQGENNGKKINLNMQQNGSQQLVVTMVRP
jgi:hypothetical protein